MKLLLRSLIFFVLIATITCWIALHSARGQSWTKKIVTGVIHEQTGCDVSIDKISGLFPFYLQIDGLASYQSVFVHDLPFERKLLSAESLLIAPNWFGMLLGNISFFYVSVHGLDLTQIEKLDTGDDSKGNFLFPKRSINIWSLHASKVTVPKQYGSFLLNSLQRDLDVSLFYNIQGKLHYNAKNEKLDCALSVQPFADDTSPLTARIDLSIDSKDTTAKVHLDIQKVASGAVFISLPIDRLEIETSLKTATKTLLNNPHVTGSWRVSGLDRQSANGPFSPSVSFQSKGTIDIPSFKTFSLSTTDFSCTKLLGLTSKPKGPRDDDLMLRPNLVTLPLKVNIKARCDISDTITISFDGSQLTYNELEIAPRTATITFQPKGDGLQGKVSLDATVTTNKEPLKLQASSLFSSDLKSSLSFSNIALALAGYPIKGNIAISLYPLLCSGKLESSSSDMSELVSALQLARSASGHFACTFAQDDLLQKVNLHLGITDLKADDFTLKTFAFDAVGNGPLLSQSVDIQAESTQLVTQNMMCKKIQLRSKLILDESERSSLDIALDGQSKGVQFAAKAIGTASFADICLQTLQLTLDSSILKNKEPISCQFSENNFSLLPFSMQCGEKTVFTGAADYTKETVNTQITLDDFPLETLDPFVPLYLFGTASGRIELFGQKQAPKLHLCVSSSDLTLWPPDKQSYEPLIASLEIEHTDAVCNLQAEIQGLSIKKPLEIRARIPSTLSLAPLEITTKGREKVQGSITGAIDITPFFAPYLERDEAIGGQIVINTLLSGTLEKPNCSGTISWLQGKLHIPIINCQMDQIIAKVDLAGFKASLTEFQARDARAGAFIGSGSATFSHMHGLQYDLKGTLDNFEIIKSDSAEVRASGDIQFVGSSNAAALLGSVDVARAKVTLSPNFQSNIPSLQITYLNAPFALEKKAPVPFVLSYDLDINLAQNGKIEGLGLDSDWKGRVHLTGKNSDIQLQGNMSLVSGSFTLAAKPFALTRGAVDFRGDLMTKSNLNVMASHDVGPVAIEISLKGPLGDPKIVFHSNPSMKEKEILSWILFNKSATEISPMEGLQLAQTILKLKGGATGLDIMDKLKETLGIDRINFGAKSKVTPHVAPSSQPNESMPNEVSFQLGKYISDGIIVTLSKDVTNEVNRVGVEAELTKNIVAEAYVGDDAETELSLRWKHRY